jgi:NADH dehydrogenase/NADH:ubiquinone oxidoreductase subunit G
MDKVSLQIDGQDLKVEPGCTILAAAEQAGIAIPTLCHHPELKPSGVCRVCVVEVEGQRTLVGACHTPVRQGMVVHTDSPKVKASRRTTLELLLAGHTGPCLLDAAAQDCRLHALAAELEAGPPLFQVRSLPAPEVVELNGLLRQDLSRCILCRRCVAACDQIAGRGVLSIAGRGYASRVVVGCDDRLSLECCHDCGICVDFCPTSALTRPQG